MPLGDGTGPYWAKQVETKQHLNQGYGSGQKRSFGIGKGARKGHGFGRGAQQNHRFGNQNVQYFSQMNHLEALKQEITMLKSELNENQAQGQNQ